MGWFETWSSRLLPGNIDLEGLLVGEDFTIVGITGVFALLGLVWGSYKLFGSVGVRGQSDVGDRPRPRWAYSARPRQYHPHERHRRSCCSCPACSPYLNLPRFGAAGIGSTGPQRQLG